MVSFPISPSGKTACDCSHLWTKFRSWGNGLRLVRYAFSIAMRSKVKHSNAVPVAPPSSLPQPSHSLGMASGISANPNLCSLTNAMRFNESLCSFQLEATQFQSSAAIRKKIHPFSLLLQI